MTERPLIVLVEEDSRVRADIAAHLEAAGFAVVGADSASEALSTCAREGAKALVTDAHILGDLDGPELARQAREGQPGLAVVLISGHSDPSSGPVPEGVAFVSKPYLLEHLVPQLRRMIN